MSEAANDDGLRGMLVAGVVGAAAAALFGLFGPHDGSVWRLPQTLQHNVGEALSAAGFGGLEASVEGQRVRLLGVVADEADVARAQAAALRAAGAGGPWAGGVTEVDASGLSVGAFERPFTWSVRRDGARVVLSGAIPSEATRAGLMAEAASAFAGADTVDDMHVAGGAPSPAFAAAARRAVRLVASLRTGEARFQDAQIAFIGDGDQNALDALRAEFANPPPPFRVRFAVSVDGLDVDHPELQGLNLANGDAGDCGRAFARLMERNVITFATGSAAIDPNSRAILDALASVALRCDRFNIEVAGHTDNQGARPANLELSRARAQAVADYLASQGVSRARLAARGFGPDSPRANNATAEGQAANRRIEFNVSG